MFIENDWLKMLMDRGENKVTSFKLSMTFQPHTWTHDIVVFIDRDANMNDNRGRKQIHPSTGWRTTCLSRGRGRIWLWSLRVAVENWHLRVYRLLCSIYAYLSIMCYSYWRLYWLFMLQTLPAGQPALLKLRFKNSGSFPVCPHFHYFNSVHILKMCSPEAQL